MSQLDDRSFVTEKAQEDFLAIDSLTTTEAITFETENQLTEIQPSTKQAHSEFQPAEGIAVTTVISEQKEETLVKEPLDLKAADSSLIPQDIIQVQETIAHDNVNEFEKEITDVHSATQVQLEHQSLISTEAVIGESENILIEKEEPLKHTADVQFENLTTSQISEIIPSEKEDSYETVKTSDAKTATSAIDVQPVAETTVTEIEESVSNVKTDETVPIKAEIEQTTVEAVVQTKTLVQESETYFDKPDLVSKSADVSFITDQSVTITQTITNEAESSLEPLSQPDAMLASTDWETHSIPLKTEHNIMDSIKNIDLEEPLAVSATTELSTLPTALKFETIVSELESDSPAEQKPDSQEVSISIKEGESITVETVTAHENETELLKLDLNEKFAATNITDAKSIVSQSQPLAQEALDDLVTELSHQSKAAELSIPLDYITVQEQTPVDNEEELVLPKQAVEALASVDFETKESISTSEEIVGLKEDVLSQFSLPELKQAQPYIDVVHKVVEHHLSDVVESTGLHKTPVLEESVAKEKDEVLNSLMISENLSQEKETEFTGEFKPFTSEATVSLEEKSQGLTITEIIPQDREEILEDFAAKSSQKANLEYNLMTVPEQSEICTEDTFKKLVTVSDDSSIANVETIPYKGLVETVHQVQEKEGEYQKIEMLEKQAETKIDTESAVSAMQIIAAETEKSLDRFKEPEAVIAIPSILEKKTAETTEVLTHQITGEVKSDIIVTATAFPEYSPSESITRTETTVIENIDDFNTALKLNTVSAQEKLDVLSEISVSETHTEAVASEFNVEADMPTGKAETLLDAIKHLQASEVQTSENITELQIPEISKSMVQVRHDEHESIISQENIVHETEKEFTDTPVVDYKTASKTIPEVDSISISEVMIRETEIPLQAKELDEKKSEISIVPMKPLIQTEVITGDAANKFDSESTFIDTAVPSQDQCESIIISENVIQESEKTFDREEVTSKTVNIELVPGEYVSVSEIVANEREEMFTDKPAITSAAEKSFVPQEATQITEVRTDLGINEFDVPSAEEKYASKDHITLNTLNITETVITETESHFEISKPDSEQSVDITLEKPCTTAEILQVVTNQSEAPLTHDKYNETRASSSIIEHIVAEGKSIKPLENISDLPVEEQLVFQQATPHRDVVHGVTETTVLTHANTDDISTKLPESRIASKTLSLHEGITITEVTTHGQTGQEILESSATETTATKDIEHKRSIITEEITSYQSHDTIDSMKPIFHKGHLNYADFPQHELIITDQAPSDDIGYIESLQPTSKTVKIVMDEVSPSLQISEVVLHEQEEEPTDLTTEKAKVIQDIQEPVVIETVQTQKPIPKIPESQKPEDATEQTIEADEVVETIEEEAPKRRVVKKKIVKKPKGDTHGTTEILFVEEEEIESQQSVVLPEEIEELPEEIKVIESVEDGVTKKTVVKKRVIKKDKKGKKETTEILTVEEEGKEPQTSITVYEEEKPKEEITSLEELPEEIKVIESVEDGVTKKTVVKKRVIKKDKKGKKETTEILTV
ncbi:unnamed protein product, partial [Diabrotica balteata]